MNQQILRVKNLVALLLKTLDAQDKSKCYCKPITKIVNCVVCRIFEIDRCIWLRSACNHIWLYKKASANINAIIIIAITYSISIQVAVERKLSHKMLKNIIIIKLLFLNVTIWIGHCVLEAVEKFDTNVDDKIYGRRVEKSADKV